MCLEPCFTRLPERTKIPHHCQTDVSKRYAARYDDRNDLIVRRRLSRAKLRWHPGMRRPQCSLISGPRRQYLSVERQLRMFGSRFERVALINACSLEDSISLERERITCGRNNVSQRQAPRHLRGDADERAVFIGLLAVGQRDGVT